MWEGKGEFQAERTANAKSLKWMQGKTRVAECRKPGLEKMPDDAVEANSQVAQNVYGTQDCSREKMMLEIFSY